MVPEAGYPGEFGFIYQGKPAFLYGSFAPAPSSLGGYQLRGVIAGHLSVELKEGSVTFVGDPGENNGGVSLPSGVVTNPVNCSARPATARIEVRSWERPAR